MFVRMKYSSWYLMKPRKTFFMVMRMKKSKSPLRIFVVGCFLGGWVGGGFKGNIGVLERNS